mgnify:CR=1 FL=1
MDKAIYSTTQAAKILNVTARTVQLWADSGLLLVGKTPGGHRRIKGESIQQLLKSMAITPQDVSEHPPKKSVLIVDDDPEFQKILRKKIEKWEFGLTIITANDGYQGLIKVGHLQPDIVLTDLKMPNMNGLHMIAALKSSSELKHSKIVVITGLSPQAMDSKWLKDSGVPILGKPVPFDTLKQIIKDTIDNNVKLNSV